jgi:hypothetical protein
VSSAKGLEDLAGLVDGPGRLRPRITEEAAVGDEAAVRTVFARLRSRRVVGKCIICTVPPAEAEAASVGPGCGATPVDPAPGIV